MSIFGNLFGFDLFGCATVGTDAVFQQQQAAINAARAQAQYEAEYEKFRRDQGNIIEGECRRVEDEDGRPFAIGYDPGSGEECAVYALARENEDGSIEITDYVEVEKSA